ncbi:hypothetical protein [Planctomycetes bacterium K23_9]|uniref:IncA protein n=1 Tax=Stieleria marina TaxID=1930275 RepID=A0A517NPA1_9BACT|nr:hypothetical protein K239x_08860 [Planctomycetes bacterium K23_9]
MSSRRRKALSPSLFPFLAVLVCTLGTLILLLALVSQNAATAATQQAEAKQAAESKLAEKTEPVVPRMSGTTAASLIAEEAFRVEQLVSFRAEQTADMERRRDQLGQVESHMQRIKAELKQLSDQADIATGETVASEVDSAELERLRAKEKAESESLAKLTADGTAKAPLVALIPHKGPNGTDRRPVYLECTAEGLTIWPEGSKLTSTHLEESVSGANPLDEALKVVRNHVMQNYGDAVPPYPLLVVRPDGIDTYAAARIALQDWDDQFGYELVPDDVNLAYGTPDPSLKKRVDEAIRAAVIDQHGMRALAQRAKSGFGRSRYGQSGAIESNKRYPRLSAADMDRRGRSSGFNDHRDFSSNGSLSSGRSGSHFGDNQGSSGADIAEALDRRLREAAGELQDGTGISQNPYAGSNGLSQSQSSSSTLGGDQSATNQSTQNQSARNQATLNPEAGTALAALGDHMPESYRRDGVRPNQFVDPNTARDGMLKRQPNPFSLGDGPQNDLAGGPSADQPNGAPSNQQSPSGGAEAPSDLAMLPPSHQGTPSNNFRMPPSASTSNQSIPNQPAPGGAMGESGANASQPSLSMNDSAKPSFDELARQAEMAQRAAEQAAAQGSMDSQNQNRNQSATREMATPDRQQWALPRSVAASRGNSIVRTIRVQCFPGRLVLVASARGGATEMFGLADDDMNRATIELASAVRDRIERWGAALPGGRWQPRLDVEVMSGGEDRYYQLQRLMSDSGVDVVGRRSETSSTGGSQ